MNPESRRAKGLAGLRHPDLDVFDQVLADYEAQQDADEEAGR